MVRLVSIDSVLRKCGLSPGIDATDTMDVQVDIQVDETAALDFVGMTDAFKVFFAVVPCSYAERLQTFDSKGLLPPLSCGWTYSVSYSASGILYRPRKALRLRSG